MSKQILFVLSSHDKLGNSGNRREVGWRSWRRPIGGFAMQVTPWYWPPHKPAERRSILRVSRQRGIGCRAPVSHRRQRESRTRLHGGGGYDRCYQFDAVYLVGGAATTWDFPHNEAIKRIAEQLHGQSKVVASICHGVIGLTRIVDKYGESLLKNRMLTGISNAEDVMMGIDKIVPVLPEICCASRARTTPLRHRWLSTLSAIHPFLQVKNPASADLLARKVIEHLNREA